MLYPLEGVKGGFKEESSLNKKPAHSVSLIISSFQKYLFKLLWSSTNCLKQDYSLITIVIIATISWTPTMF